MKIIPSSKRHHYFARVIIFFLIVAGLIVWMTGCYTCFPKQYTLIISSTEGGSVTDPGEGTFTYNSGTVVDLVATPDAGYHFVEWTGDVDTIADVDNAATNITMNGSYNITANFALGISVRDWYDLDDIRNNLSGSYILMNDLDSSTAGYEELASPTANGGKGWQPIGPEGNEFVGSFDGQGYEIRDLFIDRPDEDFVGLFAVVEEGGVIEDIGVVNAAVTGDVFVGGLVGANAGTVSDSYCTGSVTGEYNVGGLVGVNAGNVSDSYSSGNVTSEEFVGGLVGATWGTVSDSYSSGNVTGGECVGGLVGGNAGITSDSYSTGTVTGNSSVGGLVGLLTVYMDKGEVSDSYSTGSVTGNSSVGGLVGENDDGTVDNSFWDTETSGQDSSDGGTGKNTTEMQDIATFNDTETEGLDEPWDITTVANPGERNTAYIWNIVDDETYPFLSWQS